MKHLNKILIILMLFAFCLAAAISAQEASQANLDGAKRSIVAVMAYGKAGNLINQGTGFFINDKGDILTGRQILLGAEKVFIKTDDGKTYPVKKILCDYKDANLMSVSTDIKNSEPLSANTASARTGEKIIIAGMPGGAFNPEEGNVLSNRYLGGGEKIVRLSAKISPEYNGSPVFNLKGELLGIAFYYPVYGQDEVFAVSAEAAKNLPKDKEKTLAAWIKDNFWFVTSEKNYSLGVIYLWAGKDEGALTSFKESKSENPGNYEAYTQMGYAAYKLKQYDEAIELFKQAVRIKAEYSKAYNGLGLVYSDLGKYKESVMFFNQAIRMNSKYIEAYGNLGVTYYKMGLKDEAAVSLKQGLKIDPNSADLLCKLSKIYNDRGMKKDAEETIAQAQAIDPEYVKYWEGQNP